MAYAPDSRLRVLRDQPVASDRPYVLYWMTSFRRTSFNFALEQAVAHAGELGRPLIVLEALRAGYLHASDRLHAFVLQGMQDNAKAFAGTGVTYYPFVEREPGEGQGLLEALSREACVIVTDDWPGFFVPRMLDAAAERVDARLEAVDACGVLPVRAADKAFARAVDFRRAMQKSVEAHLGDWPLAAPLDELEPRRARPIPKAVAERWPKASAALLAADPDELRGLAIDHDVGVVEDRGGEQAARKRMHEFLGARLNRYAEGRNDPDDEVASGLSPWLHFGHLSAHEIFTEIVTREGWDPTRLAPQRRGQREGFWGMSAGAEGFLDQLVTWRELSLNGAVYIAAPDTYGSLPDWARRTLEEHAADARESLYDLSAFEAGATHDSIWNAAQRQLRETGRMHNYLRMLWGKKILHWTPDAETAFEIMLILNDRYALDGRDPNSFAGIAWVLGRYDRAWGPERSVFGKIRYMSSDNTRRKLRLSRYLARFGED